MIVRVGEVRNDEDIIMFNNFNWLYFKINKYF